MNFCGGWVINRGVCVCVCVWGGGGGGDTFVFRANHEGIINNRQCTEHLIELDLI